MSEKCFSMTIIPSWDFLRKLQWNDEKLQSGLEEKQMNY